MVDIAVNALRHMLGFAAIALNAFRHMVGFCGGCIINIDWFLWWIFRSMLFAT